MINIVAKKQEVQILTDTATGAAVGALAANIAVQVEGAHSTGLLQSYLMKKVKASFVIEGLTSGEGNHLIAGIARGDASIAEIQTAITGTQLERDRVSQAQKRVVLHETLTALPVSAILDTRTMTMEIEISLGGGRGIPFEEGDGWQWFVINIDDSTITTGATFALRATYWGIWL